MPPTTPERSRPNPRNDVARGDAAPSGSDMVAPFERFVDLNGIRQPTLVVNGVHDDMIPIRNSYWLSEHLPNAVLLTYPDAGHGSLFQFHESFTRQAAAFLGSDADFAPY